MRSDTFALSPLAALRDIWIVGSHLPHYHTNRPLAHSDTAFILCPTHLRLAGDQPKSGLVQQSAARKGRSQIVRVSSRATGLGDKTQVHYAQSRHDWLKRSDHRSPRVAPRRFARADVPRRILSTSRRKDLVFSVDTRDTRIFCDIYMRRLMLMYHRFILY